jgi:hypothetical protein
MRNANVYRSQALDVTALIGMVGGIALMFSASMLPEIRMLALPGFVVLVPSLLYGLR